MSTAWTPLSGEELEKLHQSNITAVEMMIGSGKLPPLTAAIMRRTMPHFYLVIAEETNCGKFDRNDHHEAITGTLLNILNGYAQSIAHETGAPKPLILIGLLQQMLERAMFPTVPIVPDEASRH